MAAAQRSRPYRFFKVIGYRTKLSSARNALGYAAFRSQGARDGDGAIVFDGRTDHADVRAFMKGLADPVTDHPKAAKAYHALFSMPRGMHDAAGLKWPEVVREVMKDYELQTGRRLTWIGVQHDDPKHPHVHLVLKATYQDRAGRTKRLFLSKAELERMKDLVARSLEARGLEPDRIGERLREEREAQQQRQRDGRERVQAVGQIMAFLTAQVRAHQKRRQREEERALEELQRLRKRDMDRGR